MSRGQSVPLISPHDSLSHCGLTRIGLLASWIPHCDLRRIYTAVQIQKSFTLNDFLSWGVYPSLFFEMFNLMPWGLADAGGIQQRRKAWAIWYLLLFLIGGKKKKTNWVQGSLHALGPLLSRNELRKLLSVRMDLIGMVLRSLLLGESKAERAWERQSTSKCLLRQMTGRRVLMVMIELSGGWRNCQIRMQQFPITRRVSSQRDTPWGNMLTSFVLVLNFMFWTLSAWWNSAWEWRLIRPIVLLFVVMWNINTIRLVSLHGMENSPVDVKQLLFKLKQKLLSLYRPVYLQPLCINSSAGFL